MPKCINDLTKRFTGSEPSPKGLGYSASAEDVDKVMEGKDCCDWIVKQTKTCKKWMKLSAKTVVAKNVVAKTSSKSINFDDLGEDFYIDVYFPESIKIELEDETGLENKLGGTRPFFIKGEKWPLHHGVPMVFFGQFIDPRESNNTLMRIFFPIHNSDDICKYEINIIELTQQNIANQKIIKMPKYNKEKDTDNNKYDNNGIPFFEPYLITKWTKSKELKSYEYVLKKLNTEEYDKDALRDSYFDSEYAPSGGIKVGGTPCFCQYGDLLKEENKYRNNNFLQITECKQLPHGWGDAGIAHIFKDSNNDFVLEWDCC
jgi:hypothetical protein